MTYELIVLYFIILLVITRSPAQLAVEAVRGNPSS
jgi:hypothetical protein